MRRAVQGEELLVVAQAFEGQARIADALRVYEVAARDETLRVRALIGKARVQAQLLQHTEALATLEEALSIDPENPDARVRRGVLRLLTHEFAGGWQDYEYRFSTKEFLQSKSPELAGMVLRNARREDLAGRRVLLVAEQGLGDQVLFASLIPDVAAIASEVVVACDNRLASLFANSFPANVRVMGQGSFLRSDYDLVVAMGSLPGLFRNTRADFPGTPYLQARAEVEARWAERLGPRPVNMRIGLSWRGGTPGTGSARRSIDLERLKPILQLPHCDFVSLQYGDVEGEIAAARDAFGVKIQSFPSDALRDYDETAGLIANLDVVVSVQTALVHLCGALGKNCLTMLPVSPEPSFAHGLIGDRMPWYGSVKLFRQTNRGEWDPVIAAVAEQLR